VTSTSFGATSTAADVVRAADLTGSTAIVTGRSLPRSPAAVTRTPVVPSVGQMLAGCPQLADTDLCGLQRIASGAAPMGETQ